MRIEATHSDVASRGQRAQQADGPAAVQIGRRRKQLHVGVALKARAAFVHPVDDHDSPVRHPGRGRVPASVAHVGLLGPALVPRVEGVDLVEAHEVRRTCRCIRVRETQVAAEDHQPPVGGERLSRAPDVGGLEDPVGRVAPQRRIYPLRDAGGGVPQPGLRRVRAAWALAAGNWRWVLAIGEPHHLAGRQHRRVDCHHGNRKRRTPTTNLVRWPRQLRRGLHARLTGAFSGRQLSSPLRTPQTRMLSSMAGAQHRPLEGAQLSLTHSRETQFATRMISRCGPRKDREAQKSAAKRRQGRRIAQCEPPRKQRVSRPPWPLPPLRGAAGA